MSEARCGGNGELESEDYKMYFWGQKKVKSWTLMGKKKYLVIVQAYIRTSKYEDEKVNMNEGW